MRKPENIIGYRIKKGFLPSPADADILRTICESVGLGGFRDLHKKHRPEVHRLYETYIHRAGNGVTYGVGGKLWELHKRSLAPDRISEVASKFIILGWWFNALQYEMDFFTDNPLDMIPVVRAAELFRTELRCTEASALLTYSLYSPVYGEEVEALDKLIQWREKTCRY